ncbi:PQQ-dependent sugar dehydrogenase, partial [Candidatus Roizmanbacteria bacterium]|nr:PQQ-dependent sugar dehydrogenase [Candidatus Roizmanbacteria bacterium]
RYYNIFFLLLGIFLFPLPSSAQEAGYSITPIANNLYVPWSMVLTDDDRMLVSQRNGTIMEITRTNEEWQQRTYYTVRDTEQRSEAGSPRFDESGEAGLMGLAIHPNYEQNRFVYAMYAYDGDGGLAARVVRFRDTDSSLEFDKTIVDNLPCASNHCGGRIAFGPDDQLFISVGDAQNAKLAQDSSALNGKILRVTDEGNTSENNPFGDLFAYSMGHRNVQGLTWHPETGVFIATEHGPSGIDGLGGGDEINVIEPGGNYGWPTVSHRETSQEFISPAYLFSPDGPPAVAPASAHIVQSPHHPWYGDLLIGGLYEGDILRCTLDYQAVTSCENLGLAVGRIRDIAENKDGELFFSTSNRDGRSTKSGKMQNDSDDRVYQLRVEENSSGELVTPRSEEEQPERTWFQKLIQFFITPLSKVMGRLKRI